jgi:uncharacterized protein with beta-barrel porin domain
MFHVADTPCSILQAYLWLIWRFHLQTWPDCDRSVVIARSSKYGPQYNGRTATAVRGELGGRVAKTIAIDNGSQSGLIGKLAWAHDEISDPTLNVSFIGLPVESFAVNSATPAHDLALVTGGAEWRLAGGVSLLAKFDGEFADRSQTYSGTGRIRYIW